LAVLVGSAPFVDRVAWAVPVGSPTAAAALRTCEGADELSEDLRAQALATGVSLAEAALAASGSDPLAHFALVCNLGKQMEDAGLGLGQLFRLRRLRSELDATLALVPDDADALAAKGALLLRLPRFFGGDVAEAEVLLRRAVAAEPDNGTARCYLGRALTARGAADEARGLLPSC
jgi:Flp pilus assembly protein TadD